MEYTKLKIFQFVAGKEKIILTRASSTFSWSFLWILKKKIPNGFHGTIPAWGGQILHGK